MALLGNMAEFDEQRESWPQCARRLSHFFAANGVTAAARKKSAFLSVIGPDSLKHLESLAPNTPEDKSYEELVEMLTKYYSPEPSEVMERYKFSHVFVSLENQ